MVNTTACKVIAKKLILIVCNKAVKRRDEEVKEAKRVRGQAHVKYTSSRTTTEWEECAIARKSKRDGGEEERNTERRT